jgi:hypothetical protein
MVVEQPRHITMHLEATLDQVTASNKL